LSWFTEYTNSNYFKGVNERRGSTGSNAPSEVSRSEVTARAKRAGDSQKDQQKNYYKVVYENKEVNKLLQMLGTAISATKAVR